MHTTKTIKGHKVQMWDKSFSVASRKIQEYFYTGVLFTGGTPETEVIEKFCIALDSAYEAGKIAAIKELRTWLGV